MLSDIWIYKKNEKIFFIILVILLITLALQNWMLGVLTAIVIAGLGIIIERNDYKQERILLAYLDELSAGVEAGTIYAVKNLPLGIAMIDENRKFVWANGVFAHGLMQSLAKRIILKISLQMFGFLRFGGKPDGMTLIMKKVITVCFINLFLQLKKTDLLLWCSILLIERIWH